MNLLELVTIQTKLDLSLPLEHSFNSDWLFVYMDPNEDLLVRIGLDGFDDESYLRAFFWWDRV